jgi:hypothetical protein
MTPSNPLTRLNILITSQRPAHIQRIVDLVQALQARPQAVSQRQVMQRVAILLRCADARLGVPQEGRTCWVNA